jgi:hypothetical protein
MRGIASALIVILGLSGVQYAAAQAVKGAGSDSIEYDKAVARVWGSITSTDHVVRACMKKAPKSKKQIEAAYREWKTRYAELIAEIDVRIDRVMNASGAYSAEELAARKADVLKRSADRYEAGLATEPADQVKRECELLPGYFTTSSFVLETHFAPELALIRARPIPAEPRN